MVQDKILFGLTIVAVCTSILAAGFVYYSFSEFGSLSGFATSTGVANLTIDTQAIINFTTNSINWGSGRVDNGQTVAQLTTLETSNVTNGNWTLTTPGGFRIVNIGNVNVTLDLLAGKTAATFIGGTTPGYQWNVSNVESGSCANNQTFLGFWVNINTTSPGTRFCGNFTFYDTLDSIRIDINLSIPYDASTGIRTDTLTATATAA